MIFTNYFSENWTALENRKKNITENFSNIYLCRNMEDEYDALMVSLGVPPTDADTPASAEPNESLLDVDDEEEVLVLEPPLEPTPAETPEIPDGSTSEQNKVNSEFLEILLSNNSDDEDMSSQKTNTTIYTKYSKYGIREGYEFSETEHDPESDRPQLGSLYHQCKTARAASLAYTCTNVEVGKETGSSKTVNFSSIGSLNCMGDSEVLNTFRGSRLTSNNVDVNQNISLSFDPATLTCISCPVPPRRLIRSSRPT